MQYRIYSKAGVDHGVYEAHSADHAFVRMCQEAGYYVTIDDAGTITYPDSDTRDLCGLPSAWDILPDES